jgi:hypothetical protein
VKKIASDMKIPYHYWNAEEPDIQALVSDATSIRLFQMIGNRKLIIIDEDQRIQDIGITLKLIIDNNHNIQVIAMGSFSFELRNNVKEPLTGRKFGIFSTSLFIRRSRFNIYELNKNDKKYKNMRLNC